MDVEKALAELMDREAIRELALLYCHYVWTKDTPALLELFAEDAVFSVDAGLYPPAGMRIEGREALRQMYIREAENRAAKDPRPFLHNHVVELTGDGHAKGVAYHEIRMGNEGLKTTTISICQDAYVRGSEGGWKFGERRMTGLRIPSLP